MLYCVHQNNSSFLCKWTIEVKLTSYAASNIVFWKILRNFAISKIQKKKKFDEFTRSLNLTLIFFKILHVQPIPLSAYGDQYKYLQETKDDRKETKETQAVTAEWLFGPAYYWYVKHSNLIEGEKFNYGFKEKTVMNF